MFQNIEGGWLMGSWRSAPVVALVSLCVVDLAEAAPTPPGPQPVNVVNPDLDVVITNTPDVSIMGTPNVSITGTPNVNIASMPAVNIANTPEVIAKDDRIQWVTAAFDMINPNSTEQMWCTADLGGTMEAVPAGYRFDLEVVNGFVYLPAGHTAAVRVDVMFDTFDGLGQAISYYLTSHALPPFDPNRDRWTWHEATPTRGVKSACVTLEYQSFSGSPGNGSIAFQLIGTVVPE